MWLVSDLDNERTDELGVTNAEGICRSSALDCSTSLRAVSPRSRLLSGVCTIWNIP